MHAARYDPMETLTRQDMYRILGMAEAYVLLTTHPAGTECMIAKLRTVRRIVKEMKP